MTMVESLPTYSSAEAEARSKGDNLISMINVYLAGYAAAGMPVDVETTGKTLHASPLILFCALTPILMLSSMRCWAMIEVTYSDSAKADVKRLKRYRRDCAAEVLRIVREGLRMNGCVFRSVRAT